MNRYRDQELTCADCRGTFVWGAREQEVYAERGYQPPERCKRCKQAQRHEFEQRGGKK